MSEDHRHDSDSPSENLIWAQVMEGKRTLPMTPVGAQTARQSQAESDGSAEREDRGRPTLPMTPVKANPTEKPAQPVVPPDEGNRPKD